MSIVGNKRFPRCTRCGSRPAWLGVCCPHCGKSSGQRTYNDYCRKCWESRSESGQVLRGRRGCYVRDCVNYSDEGRFVGDFCAPCWEFLVSGNVNHSQACRNAFAAVARHLGDSVYDHLRKVVTDAYMASLLGLPPERPPRRLVEGEDLHLAPVEECSVEGVSPDLLSKSVDDLDWSVRAANILHRHLPRVSTVSDLVQMTEYDLLRTPHMARKVVKEFKEVLAGMGLCLGTLPSGGRGGR